MFDHARFSVRMIAGGAVTFVAGIVLLGVLSEVLPVAIAAPLAIILAWIAGRKAVPRHPQ